MADTILCHDKKDAKDTIDAIGCANIVDWEYLDNGKVLLILEDGVIDQIKKENKSHD